MPGGSCSGPLSPRHPPDVTPASHDRTTVETPGTPAAPPRPDAPTTTIKIASAPDQDHPPARESSSMTRCTSRHGRSSSRFFRPQAVHTVPSQTCRVRRSRPESTRGCPQRHAACPPPRPQSCPQACGPPAGHLSPRPGTLSPGAKDTGVRRRSQRRDTWWTASQRPTARPRRSQRRGHPPRNDGASMSTGQRGDARQPPAWGAPARYESPQCASRGRWTVNHLPHRDEYARIHR